MRKKTLKQARTELRLPESLKCRLTLAAQKSNLSLNDFCIQLLKVEKIELFQRNYEANIEIMRLYESMATDIDALKRQCIESKNAATPEQLRYILEQADKLATRIFDEIHGEA